MLMQENTNPSQGSREMLSRILDLLFIQILRAWAVRPDATPAWLTGAMDPVIGDAITAIHADPAHPWTIERLAEKSNLSRSAFAERFVKRVGTPPAAYIAQVRLESAADLLHTRPSPSAPSPPRLGTTRKPPSAGPFPSATPSPHRDGDGNYPNGRCDGSRVNGSTIRSS